MYSLDLGAEGIASFPDDAQTKEELIRLADQAMYMVKESTRNNIAVANQGLLVPFPSPSSPA